MLKESIIASIALVMLFSVSQVNAAYVYEGFPAVRYKSFANTGSNEVYTGVTDLGVGSNRNEIGYNWPVPATEPITFEYDPNIGNFGQLLTSDGFGTLTYDLTSEVDFMNAFEIIVADRHTGGQVNFTNVSVDGYSLGDFIGNDDFASYEYDFADIAGLNLNDGFIFTGTIELSGTFTGGDELSRVEIKTGVVPVPAAVWLFGSGLIGLIGLRRKLKK